MRRILISLCISATCCIVVAQPIAKRAVTPDDYYAMKSPDDPHISPDGKVVAYTVISIDREHNRRQTDIWVASLDGSAAPRQLTFGDSANAPRWRPDGNALAFLSARHDPKTGAVQKPQVYELSTHGGEARSLTDLKNGVSGFEWSPDGMKLACISKIGASDSVAPGKKLSDELDYIYPEDKLDGVGYYNDQRTHIWVVDVATGSAKQISFGDQQNDHDPEWSPDSARVAYVGARTDRTTNIGANDALFILPADGGTPSKLPVTTMGMSSIRWSPDGKELAYVGSSDANFVPKIFIAPIAGGPAVLVSNEITYPNDIEWAADGKTLCYRAPVKGDVSIFRINLGTHKVTRLTSNSTVGKFNAAVGSKALAYIASDDTHPGDLYATDSRDDHPRQLTHLNADLLSTLEVQPDEAMTFKSVDGWPVEGFFTKPLNWQSGKSYPMILMIHGGPNGMWGSNWNFTVQCFAAHGWAVLRINPRGSSGYGEAFQRGVYREFGGKAYQDLMNGVDYALAKNPWIDSARLGVTGHSYGGFMTNWIIGHTTRFKAAVTQSGMTNFISDDGARDGFYGHARDFGVQFFDGMDVYWKNSPVLYADKVKTPTLFLQGQVDMRVPVEQAEEYFRALSHFGIPTELVIFPGESHVPGKTPKHVNDWMKWQIYWFDRWIDQDSNAVKPNAIS